MNIKNVQKLLLILPLLVFTIHVNIGIANAEELVVSDNGSDSNNSIQTSSSNDTNVDQSNNADVNNDIQIDANTGNNSASDNTGGATDITTGNIQVSTDINNAVNTSVVSQGCCPSNGDNKAVISGNGSNSSNNITISNSSNVDINVNHNADITNRIRGYASTGGNSASGNTNGDVSIETGSIDVFESIWNKSNYSLVKYGLPGELEYMARIYGNGTYSNNEIDFDQESDIDVDVDNDADITNDSVWDLVTGDNDADDNTNGDVNIKTGDISFTSEIVNEANKSIVDIGCCDKDEEKEQPSAPAPQAPKTEDKPSSQGGPSGQGQVLGEAIGKILPATGTNWLFYALIGNVAMLLIGMFLRLRSGRSPGFSFGL